MLKSKIEISPNTVLSLMAPTASGKTALAYELYDTGGFELISVDSALIYSDMDIGTAKPTKQELLDYPHHLVDIVPPTKSYSVANFVQDVSTLIQDIHSRDKIPLLVGGTMMYYMALFDGISSIPNTEDEIRKEVDMWLKEEGIATLYKYLQMYDPIIANKLKATDRQRITRAVEIFKQTGKPMSYWQSLPKLSLAREGAKNNQRWLGLSVMPDRAWLHNRIAMRLEQMWQEGLIEEVLDLISRYELSHEMASMRCVGYRQVIDFLEKEQMITITNGTMKINYKNNIMNTKDSINYFSICTSEACQDMKNKALYATRQLAKRQYTWLKKLNTIFYKSELDLKMNNMLSFDSIKEVKHQLIGTKNS